MENKKQVVVAFSGGLDTSFSALYLENTLNLEGFAVYDRAGHKGYGSVFSALSSNGKRNAYIDGEDVQAFTKIFGNQTVIYYGVNHIQQTLKQQTHD